jgi:lipoprotein-anchoring transpeptidase ErfK/SrfK
MRRLLPIATAAVSLALIGAGGAVTVRAVGRASSFHDAAASLERSWSRDVREGVPEAAVTPLRNDLTGSKYMHASTWSPLWWLDDGTAFITTMHQDTTKVWTSAMAVARSRAEGAMTAWSDMELQLGSYVPAAASRTAAGWEAQLQAAATPAALDELATTWTAEVVAANKAATLDEVTVATGGYGGVAALVAAVEQRVSVARGDNLNTGPVPSLVATLTAGGTDAAVTLAAIKSLEADLGPLNALISLDGRVVGQLRTLDSRVALATTHNAAGAASFAGQYASLSARVRAGGTAERLDSVAAQIVTVEDSVNAALTAVGCGHQVPNGKVIDIDVTTQSAVFFDDGCIAGQSLVTTGRPGLRTPTGTFHIYRKVSPITLISPWPTSSPYYYTPENAAYAMEFLGGGFFIHDAPWEPASTFGPGSQNGVDASHGCVHMPTPTMAWLYAWSPIGTTVIIHG